MADIKEIEKEVYSLNPKDFPILSGYDPERLVAIVKELVDREGVTPGMALVNLELDLSAMG